MNLKLALLPLLLFLAQPLAAQAAKYPYLTGCGEYEASGRLRCDSETCRLLIFQGSMAQAEFQLDRIPRLAKSYANQNVTLRIRILSTQFPVSASLVGDEIKSAMLTGGVDDLKKVHALECGSPAEGTRN